MNAQTWEALQRHGANEDSRLRLEFFFNAPSEDDANELARYLGNETNYEVTVKSHKKSALSKRTWTVTGHTQPERVALQTLDQWVTWMVVAGVQNGGCDFDGWGAELPNDGEA
jgi:hypothetical protein